MTQQDINKLVSEAREKANAATEGPWEFNIGMLREAALWIPKWDGRLYLKADRGTDVDDWKMSGNARFIAHARTAVPALCAAIEHQQRVIEKLKEQRDSLVNRMPMSLMIQKRDEEIEKLDAEIRALGAR